MHIKNVRIWKMRTIAQIMIAPIGSNFKNDDRAITYTGIKGNTFR